MTDLVQHALEVAQRHLEKCANDLESETDKLAKAEASFMASGTDKDLDNQVRATAKCARARRLLENATDAVNEAMAKCAAADLERARQQHAEDLLHLPHFDESLAHLHTRLVALDRQVYALHEEYKKAAEEGAAVWDEAQATAVRVQSHLGNILRPNLADVLLEAQIACTVAREEDDRACVSELLAPEVGHGDWRYNGLPASERAVFVQKQQENDALALKKQGMAELMHAAKVAAERSHKQETEVES